MTARGERTRQQLLDAARATFEALGYLATNVQAITARAGVAYGTFYTYFPSKEAVFAVLAADVLAEVDRAAFAEPGTGAGAQPAPRIERVVRGALQGYAANARLMAVVEQAAVVDPSAADALRLARRAWVARAAAAIAGWQAAGRADASLDPAQAAAALVSLVERSAYLWYVSGDGPDGNDAAEQLVLLCCRAIGIRRSPARRSPAAAKAPLSLASTASLG